MRPRTIVPAMVILPALLVPPSPAQEQLPEPPPLPPVSVRPAPAPRLPRHAPPGLEALLTPSPRPRSNPVREAGLPDGTPVFTIDLGRAYRLALALEGREDRPGDLRDPKTLDALVAEDRGDDLSRLRERFRQGGWEGGNPSTTDPGDAFLTALAAQQQSEATLWSVVKLERALEMAAEYARNSASSNITWPQVEQMNLQLQAKRAQAMSELLRYRDALDRLKVAVGLPPSAPMVLDSKALDGFREVFETIEAHSRQDDPDLDQLDGIVDRLPELPEVQLGGRSVRDVAMGTAEFHELLAAVDDALGDDVDAARALEAREAARGMVNHAARYRPDRNQLLVANRQRGQTLQRIVAPPEAGGVQPESMGMQILNVTASAELQSMESQVVQTWVNYQRERLRLFRALGTVPAEDWSGFLDSFVAKARPEPPTDHPDSRPGGVPPAPPSDGAKP